MRALLILIFLSACGAEPPAPSSAAPPASEAPGAAPPPAEPPVVADPCEAHRAAFRAALAAATGSCTSAADCGCFNPVVAEAGCGGITDAATSARLGAIEGDYFRAGCDWPHACAAWSCEPTCHAGRCTNASAGGRIVP